MIVDPEIFYFILLGLLGGFTAAYISAKSWDDLKTFSATKRYVLGLIIGLLYWLLYCYHGYPDFIMAWVSGFAGTDFINRLIEKYWKKEGDD